MEIYKDIEDVNPEKATYRFGDFTPYLALEKEGPRNPFSKDRMLWIEYRYRFPNGFGASVARNCFTGGHEMDLFEVAVMKGGALYYKTEVTHDVIGCCDADDVGRVLGAIASLDSHGRLPKPETHSIKGNPYLQFGDYKPTDGVETWKGHTLIRFQYDYDFPNGYGVSVWSQADEEEVYGMEVYEYGWDRKRIYRAVKYRGQKHDLNYRQVEMYMARISRLPKRKDIK